MLKKYSKMITIDQVIEKVGRLNAHKIKVLGYFILGLPGKAGLRPSAPSPWPESSSWTSPPSPSPLPIWGPRLREEAVAKGWLPPGLDGWDSTDYPILETGTLTKEEIWALRRKAVKAFYLRPSYILRKLGGVRSVRDVRSLVSNAISLLKK